MLVWGYLKRFFLGYIFEAIKKTSKFQNFKISKFQKKGYKKEFNEIYTDGSI